MILNYLKFIIEVIYMKHNNSRYGIFYKNSVVGHSIHVKQSDPGGFVCDSDQNKLLIKRGFISAHILREQ